MKPIQRDYTIETKNFPDSEIVALIDADWPKYTVASAGEKRYIRVIHKGTGKEIFNVIEVKDEKNPKKTKKQKTLFSTRTEFWGQGKAIGGWLADANERAKIPAERDDFEIEDVQVADQLENVLHSAKMVILNNLEKLGTDKYHAIMGKGDSFRVGLSTLQEYKGDRKDMIKPLYLQDVTDYLASRFNAEIVRGYEADDVLVQRAYEGYPNAVILGEDKDYRGQPVKFFDVNNPDEGIIDGNCFGRIEWLANKKKVTGYGRLFLYWQICSGDSTDCYKANKHSAIKWGDKSAFDALADAVDDADALGRIIKVFKKLYPEPVQVELWQGIRATVDWYYVANEMFQMARMTRWPGDVMSFAQWCKEYECNFDEDENNG